MSANNAPSLSSANPAATGDSSLRDIVETYTQAYVAENPRSLAQHEKAREVLPGGLTRSTLYFPPFPLTIARGEKAFIWDIDGHRYVNLVGEYTAGVYGHNEEFLRRVTEKITETGMMLSGPVEYEEKLARILCSRIPSCELVRFCNSGTEANLLALGLARKFTGREEVLVFTKGYHGGFLIYPQPEHELNVPFKIQRSEYNDLEKTKAVIEKHADSLAAIIVEPMLGSGGCIPARQDFLQLLREKATEHGIVLIFDEVLTSRLAPGGLQSFYDVTPDLTGLGKYIGGGFPSGAVGGKKEIMDLLDQDRPGFTPHFGTFNNNIASMVAGYIGLSDYFTPQSITRLNRTGDALRNTLNEICRSARVPMCFTGFGSVMNLQFTRDEVTDSPLVETAESQQLKSLFHLFMLRSGYYTSLRGLLALNLMLEENQLSKFTDLVNNFLEEHGTLCSKSIDDR